MQTIVSASRTGLQEMIKISQAFAAKMNLKFGTNINIEKSKTKCIIFSKTKMNTCQIKEVILDGHRLPWVSQVKHLGHTLDYNNSMTTDCNLKRGTFVGKVNSLLQEFHYTDANVLLNLVHSYACNIYGSNTWDLFSADSQRLYRSYNVAVRRILNLPRTSHRYLIEPLTNLPHLYVLLLARYVTFVKSLLSSDAFEVRFLANLSILDMKTVLGRSIAIIRNMTNCEDISSLCASKVKQSIKYMQIPKDEEWRLGIIKDMMTILNNTDLADSGLSKDNASDLLEFACTS